MAALNQRVIMCKVIPLVGLFSLFLLAACSEQKEDAVVPVAVAEIPPLAKVGDAVLTEEDFEFEVSRRVEQGRAIGSAEDVLQDLILRQAMLQKASASGALDDPNAKREIENQMLSQWLEQSLNAEKQNVSVSEEELREQYDAQMDTFSQPAKVRIAILMRNVNSTDTKETIESLKAELVAAKNRYLENPNAATREGRIPGFGEVAVNASEHTVSRYRGGDIGWLEEGTVYSRWPAEVLQVGFALESGAVSDVVVVDNALYVVMNAGRREAQVIPFDEAKVAMRRPLIRKKQEAVEQSFKSNLLASFEVAVNSTKSSQLQIPQASTPVPPNFQPLNSPVNNTISTP